MDVLLALLSKRTVPLPSAPLREAVEGAFRAMADSVTATGAPPRSEAWGRCQSSASCWMAVHHNRRGRSCPRIVMLFSRVDMLRLQCSVAGQVTIVG